jgi:rod shape-determining protein MreB
VAAALGAGLDVRSPIGNMIVDIGGGVCEVAVISLGGIVVSKSIKIGGDSFDEAIVRYVNDAYGLMIGERTAEGIKKKIGEVYEHKEAKIVEVKGRDIVTGMPKVINLSSKEMIGATFEPMTALIDCICEIIEKTPPELVGDILHNGIMLVGGGAKLSGLDKLIHRVTGIKTYVADDPEDCVVKGAAAKLESINKYSIEG